MGIVKQAVRRSGVGSVRELDVAKIARSQFGRPNTQPMGATDFDLLRPLVGCDTKAKVDLLRIHDATCDDILTRMAGLDAASSGSMSAQQLLLQALQGMPAGSVPTAFAHLLDDPDASFGMDGVVIIRHGDGQSVISESNEKKRCGYPS